MKSDEQSLDAALHAAGLPCGSRILVAVSGGPDSVALLHALRQHSDRSRADIEVRVAHINHGLRADESEADERFVRGLAEGFSLAIDVAAVPTIQYAKEHKLSLETAARDLRYQMLLKMLSAWPGDLIATGHTADDQAETLIMRLLRGTGLRGLAGIPARQGSVVRPFLGVTHEQILAYLQRHKLGYRLDQSNLDPRHFRNLVRHTVMPVFERISHGSNRRLSRTAGLLRLDTDYLEGDTARALSVVGFHADENEVTVSATVWRVLHPSLRRAVLRALADGMYGAPLDIGCENWRDVERVALAARRRSANRVRLPHGVHLWVDRDDLALTRGTQSLPVQWKAVTVRVPGMTRALPGNLSARTEVVSDENALERAIGVCGAFHALCDARVLGERLTLRARSPGDRLRLSGRGGSRKIQDILVDSHVPARLRGSLAIVADAAGPVWIPGFGLDERVAATPRSEEVIHLTFQPEPAIYHARMPKQFSPESTLPGPRQFGD